MNDIAERFAKDVGEWVSEDGTKNIRAHEMTVLRDDGLYRHLRFASPNCGFYWFDLITWPGSLTVNGDCGTYTFSRVTDMFEFFRGHRVNPQYWAEKVQGETRTKSYSEQQFRQQVFEDAADAMRNGTAPKGLALAVRQQIFESDEICYEDGARRVLNEFEHGEAFKVACSCGDITVEPSDILAAMWRRHHSAESRDGAHHLTTSRIPGFSFHDAWEWDLGDWDWQFLWCLHAIVWGIAQYDGGTTAARGAEETVTVAGGVL